MGKNLGCRQLDLTRKSQSPNLVAATQSPKRSHGLGTCTLKSLSKGLISTSSPVREREFEESEEKKKMSMAMVRSGLLRTTLRRVSSASSAPPKRGFASSAHHDDACKTFIPSI